MLNKYVTSLVISTCLVTGAQAHRTLEDGTAQSQAKVKVSFPTEYIHKNVRAQIDDYNSVYTAGVQGDSSHIDGLFGILERGFALTYFHLKKQTEYRFHDKALACLETIYQQVKRLNDEHLFDADLMYRANHRLAEVLDEIKIKQEGEFGSYMKGFEKITFNFCDSDSSSEEEPEYFQPPLPVVIYSNPNLDKQTHIGYKTIVDQYLQPENPRWVYQLEPSYQECLSGKKKSKKMPHNGEQAWIGSFFSHDNFHRRDHKQENDEFLRNAYVITQNPDLTKNQSSILISGLFYFVHEYAELMSASLHKVAEGLESTMSDIAIAYLNRGNEYKLKYRDNERMLKTRNKQGQLVSLKTGDGVPLLSDEMNNDLYQRDAEGRTAFSKLTNKEKQIAVARGFKRFWNCFIEIVRKYS